MLSYVKDRHTPASFAIASLITQTIQFGYVTSNVVASSSSISFSMVLCDTCINFLKELCRRPYSEYRSWNNLPIRSSEFKHHSNNRDLLLSALNCPFCALIVASFDRYDRFAKLEIRGATLLAEELEGSFSLCVKGTTSMADVFTLYEILLKEQNIGNYARCFAWISIFAEPGTWL